MPQTSNTGPLLLIGPDDLKFVPVSTDFAGLAADSLKDFDNLAAAIDADLADVAANVAAQIAFGPQLDAGIADMAGSIDGVDLSGDLPGLADILSAGTAGDANASTAQTALNTESTTELPPTPGTIQSLRPGWTPDPDHPGCFIVPGGGRACPQA